MRFPTSGLVPFLFLSLAQGLTPEQETFLSRIYHSENSPRQIQTDFIETDFLFSQKNSAAWNDEWPAALEAFQNPSWRHPRLQWPAACTFPSRKRIVEKILGKKLPEANCPDLDLWRKNLRATHVSLLFAGAYAQNPASIFGHTLLRLSDRKDPLRTSPLLSHVVGFLAMTGDDGTFHRIRKGLTGQYPGHFLLDPFYIKLGVYNNAESRDLWESDLNLSPEEIDLLIDHLWEISHFSKPYYFIGKNCSYQILKVFEAVKPELNVTKRKLIETLPHDSIRWMTETGLSQKNYRYYPSLWKKIKTQLEKLSPEQMQSFLKARDNLEFLKNVNDIQVLEVLNDHWLMINYQKQTQLNPQEKILMETSLSQRSRLGPSNSANDVFVFQEKGPLPAYLGHKTRSGKWGLVGQEYFAFQFFYGAHGFEQDGQGFDDFSSIQYLGVQHLAPTQDARESETQIVFADIRSFENYTSFDKKKSWLVRTDWRDTSALQKIKGQWLFTQAGLGISNDFSGVRPYALATLNSETDLDAATASLLRPGFMMGLKWQYNNLRIIAESSWIEFDGRLQNFTLLTGGYSLNRDQSVYLNYSNENHLREDRFSAHFEIHF